MNSVAIVIVSLLAASRPGAAAAAGDGADLHGGAGLGDGDGRHEHGGTGGGGESAVCDQLRHFLT